MPKAESPPKATVNNDGSCKTMKHILLDKKDLLKKAGDVMTAEEKSFDEKKPKKLKKDEKEKDKKKDGKKSMEEKSVEERKPRRPRKKRDGGGATDEEPSSQQPRKKKNKEGGGTTEEEPSNQQQRKKKPLRKKDDGMMTAEEKSVEEKRNPRIGKRNRSKEVVSGEIVQSEVFRWKVSRLLGAGGFGSVYKVIKNEEKSSEDVTKESAEEAFAMKTEKNTGDPNKLRLKIEVLVLLELKTAKRKKHFVELVDRGRAEKFKFIVMTLVGPSLDELRREFIQDDFSKATVMNVAIQSLEALEDLHQVGWIHRDIKPQNFTIGIGEHEKTIYVLDFGISRKIYHKDSRQLKSPRLNVKFVGTMRFCSRNCHRCTEQHRGDDLECWIYMIFDLFDVVHGLPWRKEKTEPAVFQLKSQFMAGQIKSCFERVPTDFANIVKYVTDLTFKTEPDYSYVNKLLMDMAQAENINLEAKLDWIGVARKEIPTKREEKQNSTGGKQQGEDMRSDDKEGNDNDVETAVSPSDGNKKKSKKRKQGARKRKEEQCSTGTM